MKTPADKWGEPVIRNFTEIEVFRQRRRVRMFNDFPEKTKRIYAQVAACFPGVQVWACGSRVRGDYVNETSSPELRRARILAGMRDKIESDFDFWINGTPKPKRKLPPKTEQVKCRVPETEKVPLPLWIK